MLARSMLVSAATVLDRVAELPARTFAPAYDTVTAANLHELALALTSYGLDAGGYDRPTVAALAGVGWPPNDGPVVTIWVEGTTVGWWRWASGSGPRSSSSDPGPGGVSSGVPRRNPLRRRRCRRPSSPRQASDSLHPTAVGKFTPTSHVCLSDADVIMTVLPGVALPWPGNVPEVRLPSFRASRSRARAGGRAVRASEHAGSHDAPPAE